MSTRYTIKVNDGKLNIKNDYIQMDDNGFQRLTKSWIESAYELAKDLSDTESIEKLENLDIPVRVPPYHKDIVKLWNIKNGFIE